MRVKISENNCGNCFDETSTRSRSTLRPSDKKMESEDEALYFYGAKWDLHS